MQTSTKSPDAPPTYNYQPPQAPVTGTARLLKIHYSECSNTGSSSEVKRRHDYTCINLPGLPIANINLEGYHQILSAAGTQFLTTLLNQNEFQGWEFYSAGPSRIKLGQSVNCRSECSVYQVDIIITKAKA